MDILLLGKNGQVGWEAQRALSVLGNVVAVGRDEVDVATPDALRALIDRVRPGIIVNASAHTAVDKAETEPDLAWRINAQAPGVLAEEAERLEAWLVHYSTDYVFDGGKEGAYVETDAINPLSVYGRTKAEGENAVRTACRRHLIFRTSWVFAARGRNFARTMLRLARDRDHLRVVADQIGAPTGAELIADVTALALARLVLSKADGEELAGTYHLVAGGETSWHGFARAVIARARARGLALTAGPEDVEAIATADYPTPAARPRNSRLSTAKVRTAFGVHLPDWRYHADRLVDELLLQGDA